MVGVGFFSIYILVAYIFFGILYIMYYILYGYMVLCIWQPKYVEKKSTVGLFSYCARICS